MTVQGEGRPSSKALPVPGAPLFFLGKIRRVARGWGPSHGSTPQAAKPEKAHPEKVKQAVASLRRLLV